MTTVLIITMRRSMLIVSTFKLTMLKKKTNVLRGVTLENITLPYSLTEEKIHS